MSESSETAHLSAPERLAAIKEGEQATFIIGDARPGGKVTFWPVTFGPVKSRPAPPDPAVTEDDYLSDDELREIMREHWGEPGEGCNGDSYKCGYLWPCPTYRLAAEVEARRDSELWD